MDLPLPNKRLLRYLFLFIINNDIAVFIETWNNRTIRTRGQSNRSPIEIYAGALGQRGDELDAEELATYGVD